MVTLKLQVSSNYPAKKRNEKILDSPLPKSLLKLLYHRVTAHQMFFLDGSKGYSEWKPSESAETWRTSFSMLLSNRTACASLPNGAPTQY